MWGSSMVLLVVERYPGVVYVGAGVLAWTSAKMMSSEPFLKPWTDPSPWLRWLFYLVIPLVLGVGWFINHRRMASRIHARLVPAEDGVQIEDLNSTNGSFINDRRVIRETARLGDEIGFDKLRFRLVGSGAHGEPIHIEATRPQDTRRSGLPWLWIGLAVAVVAAVGTIALQ